MCLKQTMLLHFMQKIFSTIILKVNYQKQGGEHHTPALQETPSEAMQTAGQSFAGL